jgi:GDP-L-fucose synthase
MRGGTLVTGAGGLLGNALRRLLPDAMFAPPSRDCDLADPRWAEELFSSVRPARVLHLAARVGGVKLNAEKNAELYAENVRINTNVLAAAQRHGATRLISLLSACAFDFPEDRPAGPADLHAALPFAGNLGYAYSKRALDVHTRILRAQHGVAFSTITPVTLYGPHDNDDPESGHVVAALLRKAVLARRDGRPLEVWGTGLAVRQFVFVDDAARVLIDLLERDLGAETLIVAPDDGVAIAELARAAARAAGFAGEIVFDPSKPEGAARRVLSRQDFQKTFPGFRFTPLDEGLRSAAAWIEARVASGSSAAR